MKHDTKKLMVSGKAYGLFLDKLVQGIDILSKDNGCRASDFNDLVNELINTSTHFIELKEDQN